MREQTYRINIEGLPITVTKKRMKNMYLRVSRESGDVTISAPHQASRAEIECFARAHMDWVEKYRMQYEEERSRRETEPEPEIDPLELRRRREKFTSDVERLVLKWEPVMGVTVSGVTIRQMKTRWGSCNVKSHHINLNLALADKPPECLEYVVVHEMTHLLEPSHNEVFWAYMTKFYPDWKRVRKMLKESGL